VLSVGAVTQTHAATNGKPVELVADTIEYDSVNGNMIAKGGIQLTQEGAVMTGTTAEYNTKTNEAHITGGVKVVKDEATLTSVEVRSYDNNHIVALGDAVLIKGDNRLDGPQIDYYVDKQYALVPNAARLTMPDSLMTANQIEAFMAENRVVASGNVHMVNDIRKLDATSDQAVYYGAKEAQGKVVMTGNARAVQDGNVLTGNSLTLYLDDKTMDAQGRTKLIIKPQ
jgi:lipopolysaccharide export system protein LptA